MEWVKAIAQLLASVAWPATVLTLLIMFRREVRQRLASVTEVKYPGGSITMKEVERLEAQVEQSTKTALDRSLVPPVPQPPPPAHTDLQLYVAQVRLDAEKELFRLSSLALSRADAMAWTVGRRVSELEKAGVLPATLGQNLHAFLEVANKILHGPPVPDELVVRSATVGGTLVAALRHRRLVFEAERDFDGHGLWHMHRHIAEPNRKYYFWSAVAASLPLFGYDYEVYREAAEGHNEKASARGEGESHDFIYLLPLDEFVSVLEFREQELLRLIQAWNTGNWTDFQKANDWQWPKEWGHLGWGCPILRERASLFEAEQDLMQTRASLERYRSTLLAAR